MALCISLINSFRQLVFLQVFTIYLRYLIGGAFIIAAFGMGKINGEALHMNSAEVPLQDLQPIQQFFRIIGYSGLYWQFIGWSQIIAGVLLMTHRFATVGAIVFFALISNIFVITINYDFSGTPVVTGLMLLATTFLLLWDLDRLQFLLVRRLPETLPPSPPLPVADHPFWMYLGCIMIASITFMALLRVNTMIQLVVPFLEGLIAFILFFTVISKRRSSLSVV